MSDGSSSKPSAVAIALGSNLGDRETYLRHGVGTLRGTGMLLHLRVSSFIETEPVGVVGQPPYLNGVLIAETTLSARGVLDLLLDTEHQFGRVRPFERAPRTLDLDLILFGEERIEEPGLVVPHPRFRERLFVLEPLAEVAPGWIDPATGKTISALLRELRAAPSRPS